MHRQSIGERVQDVSEITPPSPEFDELGLQEVAVKRGLRGHGNYLHLTIQSSRRGPKAHAAELRR